MGLPLVFNKKIIFNTYLGLVCVCNVSSVSIKNESRSVRKGKCMRVSCRMCGSMTPGRQPSWLSGREESVVPRGESSVEWPE